MFIFFVTIKWVLPHWHISYSITVDSLQPISDIYIIDYIICQWKKNMRGEVCMS